MKILSKLVKVLLITGILINIGFAQSEKEVKLNAKDKKALNTFFSNFSEAFVSPFEKEAVSDQILINFGVLHTYKNNFKSCQISNDGNSVKIKSALVDAAAYKYFGKIIKKHQSIKGVGFSKDAYSMPQASGETYVFSMIDKIWDIGNNSFTVTVNIYSASSGWTGNPHGTQAEWQKKEAEEGIPELTGKMKATILKLTESGKTRYILVDYRESK